MASKLLFWKDSLKWKRASVNTLRCLAGCSIGDLGTLFALQAAGSPLSPHATMIAAMTAGLATSYTIEVGYLMRKDGMKFANARDTALKMSLVSMLSMELAETSMDLYLTQGILDVTDPIWWGSLGVSLIVGFTIPLPYNYYMLKKFGKCCH
jgi:hypothetical protein